jgi:hypothetical protein
MPRKSVRAAAAVLVTAPLLIALASTGGLSYAASSVDHVARSVSAATTAKHRVVLLHLTAGSDQYEPGYGFGDPSHNHAGPPGLIREGIHVKFLSRLQSLALPPLRDRGSRDGLGVLVTTAFNVDEQAHLYISVVDKSGAPLLLTQDSKRGGSLVGKRLTGPQTKFIQYAVLIPRTIPLTLRIPANLVAQGRTYRIRISATDPSGNKSSLLIPVSA